MVEQTLSHDMDVILTKETLKESPVETRDALVTSKPYHRCVTHCGQRTSQAGELITKTSSARLERANEPRGGLPAFFPVPPAARFTFARLDDRRSPDAWEKGFSDSLCSQMKFNFSLWSREQTLYYNYFTVRNIFFFFYLHAVLLAVFDTRLDFLMLREKSVQHQLGQSPLK